MSFKLKVIIFILAVIAAITLDMVPAFAALALVWLILKVFGVAVKTIIKILACVVILAFLSRMFM